MSYQRTVRELFERVTSTHIYRRLPPGANIGQIALEFNRQWPAAGILCFEPVEATFRKLQAAIDHQLNVMAFQLAMGTQEGSAA